MTELNHKLKPDETVQKALISTTSRMVGEYENKGIVITHAWPNVYDSSATFRMFETPLSRSGFIIAFETPPIEKRPGVIIPNYTPRGENICAYLSVLFGKRFDCHGLVEGTGFYQIPDLTAYTRICDPKLPFNSHEERNCFPVSLKIDQFSLIERVFTDTTIDATLMPRLNAICKFYMQALQNAEYNPEVAYLHLITAGEILSSFFEYSKEEILDEITVADLDIIKNNIKDGDKIAKRMRKRFTAVKKSFVKSLCSLLDDSFYMTAGSEKKFVHFKSENIDKNIGAAYDLRSRYVHTGVSFGMWIGTSRDHDDLRSGKPVVGDAEFAEILQKAPKFTGLERLMRYCILKFMSSHGLLVSAQNELGAEVSEFGA